MRTDPHALPQPRSARSRRCASLLFTGLIALTSFTAPASADEGAPAPPAQPPVVQPPAELAPPAPSAASVRIDLEAYMKSLLDALAQQARPPRRTATKHGLYDVWSAALKPRVGRMQARMKVLADRNRWQAHPNTGRLLWLSPEGWPRAVREAAALYTELGGARKGYLRANVRLTSPYGRGLSGDPTQTSAGYPIERLGVIAYEREFHRRLHLRRVVWRDEVSAYWHLLGRLHTEMVRRAEAWRRFEARLRANEILTDAADAHEEALRYRVEGLELTQVALRTFMATIQAAEEDRLRAEVILSAAPAADRAAFNEQILAMRTGRLEAREHDSERHSEYGSRLRKGWLGPRKRLIDALEKARREAASQDSSPK